MNISSAITPTFKPYSYILCMAAAISSSHTYATEQTPTSTQQVNQISATQKADKVVKAESKAENKTKSKDSVIKSTINTVEQKAKNIDQNFVLETKQSSALVEEINESKIAQKLEAAKTAKTAKVVKTDKKKVSKEKPTVKSTQSTKPTKYTKTVSNKTSKVTSKTTTKKTAKKPIKNKRKKSKANRSGTKIVSMGNTMANGTKEIVRGSCWDYVNTVFNRAGYPMRERVTIHKGTKNRGPYANINTLKPGDWMYYINHSYYGIEHSGIFIKWVDKQKKIAKVLSYSGQNKKKPGRYRNYDLSNVYNIIRAKD